MHVHKPPTTTWQPCLLNCQPGLMVCLHHQPPPDMHTDTAHTSSMPETGNFKGKKPAFKQCAQTQGVALVVPRDVVWVLEFVHTPQMQNRCCRCRDSGPAVVVLLHPRTTRDSNSSSPFLLVQDRIC